MARVEDDRKVVDDLPTLVAAAERGNVEDAQELVMVHRVLKPVSSVDRLITGRVIVQRWMMVPRVRRNEILEPTVMVRGRAAILTVLVTRSVRQTLCYVDPLCGTAVSPVQDDDECEAHAAFLVESEGFGVLDCGATHLFW